MRCRSEAACAKHSGKTAGTLDWQREDGENAEECGGGGTNVYMKYGKAGISNWQRVERERKTSSSSPPNGPAIIPVEHVSRFPTELRGGRRGYTPRSDKMRRPWLSDERRTNARRGADTLVKPERRLSSNVIGEGDISEKKETQRKMTYPCSAVAEQEALAQKSKHTAG